MSAKRKEGPGGSSGTKSAKSTTDARPSKRAKSDKVSKEDKEKPAKDGKAKAPKDTAAPVVSKLKEEEPIFPRGGGSVLTPLEHKQIQIQAKQDALFEQESGTSTKKAEKAQKRRRKSTSKSESHLDKTIRDEDAVKIESLNYKRLVRGSLVLGQVSEINTLEIVLSLPNNLTGHVPITAISSALTMRLQASAEKEDDEDEQDSDVDLNGIFEVGQYVRAYVVSTVDQAASTTGKLRHHIQLSLQPEQANSGLSEHDVVTNVTVMASVASVEDHGFVMDLSIADSDMRGFLPRKQLDGSIAEERMQPGSVILCLITGKSPNGKIAQLTTLKEKLINPKNHPSEATTVDAFLPGTTVDALISEISDRGLVGKVMGHLDVTADLVHSGIGSDGLDLESKFKVGLRLKARVICTFPEAEKPKLGISILEHVMSMTSKSTVQNGKEVLPPVALPSSAKVEKCTVKKVEPAIGLYVDVGVEGVPGFVHISRVKDGKIDALFENSGPYKVGSIHPGRVLGYSGFDGMFMLSLEQHILEQPFLRIQDVPVGEVVSGTIERLVVNKDGLGGVTIQLADGISGLVPEMHLADVRLQNPEKKFRPGMKVKARVLSTDASKHQIRLTLKKTLVNSDAPALKSYEEATIGMQVPGTIVKVMSKGAIVQFYGTLRGYLPVSEMSEAYIFDPKEHFREGQVVSVHILNCVPEEKRLIVSCKDPSAFGLEKQIALKNLKLGDLVSTKVTQKTEDDVFVELADSGLKAVLPVGHLTDKSASKTQSALKKIHAGQTLDNLVVLDKNEGRRSITLSQKPSLVKAAKQGTLLTSIDEAKVGKLAQGFVRNIKPTAVFVQFAAKITALVPKSMLASENREEADFGMHRFQPILVKIVTVDRENGRLVAAMPNAAEKETSEAAKDNEEIKNALDESIKSIGDLEIGKITKACIVEIKETQINVKLADNIQGRIDISQIYDDWSEITDPKQPLAVYRPKQIVKVRVLGLHEARDHRFLAFSHRSVHSVVELTCKPSQLKAEEMPTPLSLDTLRVGSEYVVFVNNHGRHCLWVNLSPTVRGRINALDVSDDLSLAQDLQANFPVGSALRARVTAISPGAGREGHVDLSARSGSGPDLTFDNVETGMVVPGKIVKVNDRQVIVKLSESLVGPVHMPDLADDYDEANPLKYQRNDIVRVAIVELDKHNKKLRLSTRPSRIMSSTLPIKDKEVTKSTAFEVGELVRGFVKNVSDKGLFVNLGGDVTAMAKIRDLSDSYLKDWKDGFQVDQLVKGRIISVSEGRISLSLKPSVVEKDWVPLLTISDLKVGQVLQGKVRKVETFGVFVDIDGSENLSGLCHRTELADKPVADPNKLYSAGDAVKAKVLKVTLEKKRISLGLKPSYFQDDEDENSDVDVDDSHSGARLDSDDESNDDEDEDEEMSDDGGAMIFTGQGGADNDCEDEDEGQDSDVNMDDAAAAPYGGLDAGGFDWTGAGLDADNDVDMGGVSGQGSTKKSKSHMQVDKTAQLDANGPQNASDYERLLLSQPDSSQLWIQYMAFQMKVSELANAREIAERAIKSINIREETEKLNVWVAYLNLEVAYGTEETVEEVFKRACTYNDAQEVHERLASIYIHAKKIKEADDLYETMVKKFGSKSPKIWTNYAHFLHTTAADPARARALLPRALQVLKNDTHAPVLLITKFAALEFRSPNGNPEQGRTLFENVLAQYPKKFDLWNQLLDLEIANDKNSDPATIRDIFERGSKVSGLKAKRAKTWFRRWAEWETERGDAKSRDAVTAKAQEWARRAEERKKKEASRKDGDQEDSD